MFDSFTFIAWQRYEIIFVFARNGAKNFVFDNFFVQTTILILVSMSAFAQTTILISDSVSAFVQTMILISK